MNSRKTIEKPKFVELCDANFQKEIDGKPVTAETTFTAKKSTGSVEVEFTFDATGLGGTTVVCFEELWQDDLKMAVHADIEDQDQSIFFPEIGTQVKDSETGLQMTPADDEVTLIDPHMSKQPYLQAIQDEYNLLIFVDDYVGNCNEADAIGVKSVVIQRSHNKHLKERNPHLHFCRDWMHLLSVHIARFIRVE